MMNIKAAYQYQLADHKKSILIFYGVILALLMMLFIGTASISLGESTFSGFETATAIFLFVSGLSSFKEPFLMLMQNGVSRKSVFKSRLLVTLTVVLFMALIDKVILLLGKAIVASNLGFQYFSLYEQLYPGRLLQESTFLFHMNIFLFDFLMYLSFITIGYFITIMFYRLNKAGKIAVGAGVPVGLFIVLPIIDSALFDSRISGAIARFFDIAFGYTSVNPYAAMLTFTFTSIIISFFTWLLMRKAVAKV